MRKLRTRRRRMLRTRRRRRSRTWRNKQFRTSNRRELYVRMQLSQQLLHHLLALVLLEVLLVRAAQILLMAGSTGIVDLLEQELDNEVLPYTLYDNVRPTPVLCPWRVPRTCSRMISSFIAGADKELDTTFVIWVGWVSLFPSFQCCIKKDKIMLTT